jgi:tetrahydromethanopterin S-methyltransferase subunit B
MKLEKMGLFAQRDTIKEALAYADTLAGAIPSENQIALHTAVYVVYNTMAEIINKGEDMNISYKDIERRVTELENRADELGDSYDITQTVTESNEFESTAGKVFKSVIDSYLQDKTFTLNT